MHLKVQNPAFYTKKRGVPQPNGLGTPLLVSIESIAGYTIPCASMVSATFRNPAMLAPATRLPATP